MTTGLATGAESSRMSLGLLRVFSVVTGQRCGSARTVSRTTMTSPVAEGMVVRDGAKRERLRVLELLPGGVARCVDGARRMHWLSVERLRVVKR